MNFITPDNVWQMHASAVEMGADSIAERCIQYGNILKQQQQQQQAQQRQAQQPAAPQAQQMQAQQVSNNRFAQQVILIANRCFVQMYAPMSVTQAGSPATASPVPGRGSLPQLQPVQGTQVYAEQWGYDRHAYVSPSSCTCGLKYVLSGRWTRQCQRLQRPQRPLARRHRSQPLPLGACPRP